MDLYKAPDANVSLPSEIPSRPVRGIVLGAMADLVVSTLLFIGYAVIVGFYMASNGASEREVTEFFLALEQDDIAMIVSYAVGGTGSALGGYICARNARIHEYRYGAILAVIMSLFGAYFEPNALLLASGVVLTWIAIFAGVYWGRLRNQQDAKGG